VTQKRLRWIAIQAIIVIALAAIVVATLLKPESRTELTGINGGAQTPTVASTPGNPGGSPGGPGPNGSGHGGGGQGGEGHHGGAGHGNGSQHGSSSAPGVATASVGGSPPVAPTTPSQPSPTRPEGGSASETPTGDQYQDTLGQLDAALD
jgi:hypothetical protein